MQVELGVFKQAELALKTHLYFRTSARVAADNDANSVDLKRFYRWSSDAMPLKYIDASTTHAVQMAKRLTTQIMVEPSTSASASQATPPSAKTPPIEKTTSNIETPKMDKPHPIESQVSNEEEMGESSKPIIANEQNGLQFSKFSLC